MVRDFSKEKFDIIIQAGQSNSEGCGIGDASNPYEPNDSVWFLNNYFTISQADEWYDWRRNHTTTTFSLSFAREYIQKGRLKDGRKLLILRAAVGGTGFSDKRWGLQDDLFIMMTEMIKTSLALNPENRLVALLWHQGETDAQNAASYDMHFKNLSALVNAVRTAYSRPDLPFVAGDFVHHWKLKNIDACEPVAEAVKDVCESIGNGRFVETSGLLSNDQAVGDGDDIHFCRESLYELGRKYFDAFESI